MTKTYKEKENIIRKAQDLTWLRVYAGQVMENKVIYNLWIA